MDSAPNLLRMHSLLDWSDMGRLLLDHGSGREPGDGRYGVLLATRNTVVRERQGPQSSRIHLAMIAMRTFEDAHDIIRVRAIANLDHSQRHVCLPDASVYSAKHSCEHGPYHDRRVRAEYLRTNWIELDGCSKRPCRTDGIRTRTAVLNLVPYL